jgi:hypothetical protein
MAGLFRAARDSVSEEDRGERHRQGGSRRHTTLVFAGANRKTPVFTSEVETARASTSSTGPGELKIRLETASRGIWFYQSTPARLTASPTSFLFVADQRRMFSISRGVRWISPAGPARQRRLPSAQTWPGNRGLHQSWRQRTIQPKPADLIAGPASAAWDCRWGMATACRLSS